MTRAPRFQQRCPGHQDQHGGRLVAGEQAGDVRQQRGVHGGGLGAPTRVRPIVSAAPIRNRAPMRRAAMTGFTGIGRHRARRTRPADCRREPGGTGAATAGGGATGDTVGALMAMMIASAVLITTMATVITTVKRVHPRVEIRRCRRGRTTPTCPVDGKAGGTKGLMARIVTRALSMSCAGCVGSDANRRIGQGTVTALRPVLQPVCSPVKSGQDRPRPSIQARWR